MLKAEIEAQRCIVSDYPDNACTVAEYVLAEAPDFTKRQMWYAVYGLPPSANAGPRGTRFSAHLVFNRSVRKFFTKASQFLSGQRLIEAPMPDDAIVEGPLMQAMLEPPITPAERNESVRKPGRTLLRLAAVAANVATFRNENAVA